MDLMEMEERELSIAADKKYYVLDTNVLIASPDAIEGFQDNVVVVTDVTLKELDGLKKAPGDTGYNAREAIRNIAKYKNNGDYRNGINLPNGGIFMVSIFNDFLNMGRSMTPDEKITVIVNELQSYLRDTKKENPVILVTNDVAMQVRASILGITVQEYRNVRVKDSSYTGRIVIETENYELINRLYSDGETSKEEAESLLNIKVENNQFITVFSGNQSVLLYERNGKLVVLKDKDKKNNPFGIIPRNTGQRFALNALLAPASEIPLVILKGPAGCAKTFLSVAVGLDMVMDGKYRELIISRNNVLADNPMGYLKGTLEEKMDPLLAPFYDNIKSLLRMNGGKDEDKMQIEMQVEDMKEDGTIELAPLAYIRGRNLDHSFIIIDEVQNATPNQIKSIVTRLAEGSKLVLCGDPDQIDASYLDKENNGLVYVAETMKGSKLCAQITFSESECVRSELAKEALQRMK